MKYHCTPATDFDDLFGRESSRGSSGFEYGPIPLAMMQDETLVLENSAALSPLQIAKLKTLAGAVLLIETATLIRAGEHFQLVFA